MRLPLVTQPGRSTASAYTLAEVIIAVLLVGIMTVSLYGGFSSGFAVMQLAREDLRATQILMQKMEAVRLCTWRQLSNSITFSERYDPLEVASGSAGAVYSGSIRFQAPNPVPGSATYYPNMRLVTASIYWTNVSGGKRIVRSREMQTMVARHGLQSYLWGAIK